MTAQSVFAWADDALGRSDAVELSARMLKGEVSSGELVEAAIARAERVNPQLNALVVDNYASARVRVKSTDSAQAPLAGIPSFIKDNSDVAGLPTRHGSRATPDRPAKKNGRFVEQFLATGLLCLGKTTTPEFGIPPTTESLLTGATGNPWHTGHSSGGSSGGSAALVAAGVVPIAHANDGGGSIRIPAACRGLVGLKPSQNRLVNYDGTSALPINVVHDGVVTRTVRDTALFMAEAEKHYRNPRLPALGHVREPGSTRYRIGFVRAAMTGLALDPEVNRVLEDTARHCAGLGHYVEEVASPFDSGMADDFLDYYASLFFGMTRLGRVLMGPGFAARKVERFTDEFAARFRRRIWRYPLVLNRLRQARAVTERLYQNYDLLLCPTLSAPPPKNGTLLDTSQGSEAIVQRMLTFAPYTAVQNITGEPAISLPLGRSAQGLPIGMQFAARYGNDASLLRLAFELESAVGWSYGD